MALGISLNCCCECPGFCNDVSRATILITLSGITGTRSVPGTNCPTCSTFNQTYPLTYRADGSKLYSLVCAPYASMVTSCTYAYRLQCDTGKIELHFLAYTTAGGDRRGYLEVRFFGSDLWIQKADFLMASGATSLDCLAFTLTGEPLVYCNYIGSAPPSDCEAATAFDLSIAA